MIRRKIKSKVIGGLGNQLFIIAATYSLSVRLKKPMLLDVSSLNQKKISELEFVFDLKNLNAQVHKDGSFRSIFWKVIDKLRFIRFWHSCIDNLIEVYRLPSIGFDHSFLEISKPKYLTGYFQTHRYIDAFKENFISNLKFEDFSDWFQRMCQSIKEIDPVVIHIRRGDYLDDVNDFIGALSMNYFKSAMAHFDVDFTHKNVWIFTDSPEIVKSEIKDSEFSSSQIIIPPKDSSAFESLFLMSLSKKIIISNSTYSWWSAYLSSEDSKVIAPHKWFKGIEDPKDLIPNNWIKVKSSWLN